VQQWLKLCFSLFNLVQINHVLHTLQYCVANCKIVHCDVEFLGLHGPQSHRCKEQSSTLHLLSAVHHVSKNPD